ncbi:hypothetical protein [Marinitoga lauensis]|uniref:hypothetical protein n=1 Tax=Marinitoga lauensis TaxID=2201189 RepID=UPI001011C44A|nr:hypothetical protein [Marinitoga lauensis]
MKKYNYLFIILVITILIFASCIRENKYLNNENENLNISKVIDIDFNNNFAVVTSKVTADSFEFLLSNVKADQIDIPSLFMSIVKEKDGNLLVAISTSNFVSRGDTLLTIKSTNFKIEKIDYYSRNTMTKEMNNYDFNPYNWKWGGLLGDFNLNGEVDLTDFASFVYYYGKEPWNEDVPDEFSRFDIGPALNIAKKGIWANIYDYKSEDWNINIIDFSIFTANFGYNINEPEPDLIELNSTTNLSIIPTASLRNIGEVFINIPDLFHNVSNILYENEDFINSLIYSLNDMNISEMLLNIINMPDILENSLQELLERIGNYSEKLNLEDYMDKNLKWEINNFDWNNDGLISGNTELHINATVTYIDNPEPQRVSLGLYSDLILGDLSNIENLEFIGIDNSTPGDAIFDWEIISGEVTPTEFNNYTPIFDDNDYLVIDEGLVSTLSFIFKNIYAQGNILYLYNWNSPSATLTEILENNDTFEASMMELLTKLSKDGIITSEELEDNIFGNMLEAKDENFETRVASIQNSIISLKNPIKYGLEDSIIDYLYKDHDLTSGPMELFSKWNIFDNNITRLFITDINLPIHLGGSVLLYPAVFFENPEDFKNLNIYLPDITLEGTFDGDIPEISTMTINFPDPYFGNLISGIDSPIIIIDPLKFLLPPPPPPNQESLIYQASIEGITRIPIPDNETGIVTPELALRFDANISNPDNVAYVEVYDNSNYDEYITDLMRMDESDYFYNETYFNPEASIYYENDDYTIEVYDFNGVLTDFKTLYLGNIYPIDTFEITEPFNYDTYYFGNNVILNWFIPNPLPYYEGAEINLAKFDPATNEFDWKHRIRVADDYDSNTPNFNMTDLSYEIPTNLFDTPGTYIIELVIYNWSDNTSFEYHVMVNIQ